MKIAVLSGKGGTGKTLISVNMAVAAGEARYIDCDVEEPNGHLFLRPKNSTLEEVTVKIPNVNGELCNGCGQCVEFCKFNALAHTGKDLMVFDVICHSCGGCVLVCPEKALDERGKVIGVVESGYSSVIEDIHIVTGILNTGEASGVPIIDTMLDGKRNPVETTIIDCPPGSACIVMDSIKDADYCVLVTEPTLFGVHNLNMVYELVKLFNKPHGVVINKCLEGEDPAEKFCVDKGIEVLGKIPFDEELGSLNSNGLIAAHENKKHMRIFTSLLEKITKGVHHEAIVNS